MPSGICKMCLQQRELCDSHFMPRALYTLCRSGEFEPVRMSSTLISPTSRQITNYLLCFDCEQRLNKFGEEWVLPLLPGIGKQFRLLERVTKHERLGEYENRKLYATANNPDIDGAKLLHFIVGIFWKASVHSWKGGSDIPVINLGDTSESLRRFLRGETDLPQTVAVCLSLDNAPTRLIAFVEPYQVKLPEFKGVLLLCSGDGCEPVHRSRFAGIIAGNELQYRFSATRYG